MRTQEEIQEEIKKLKELEPRIRPYSAFGGDNRANLRAEIKVLEQGLSEDDIWNLAGIVDYDTISIMMSVREWMDGEDIDGSPSEGWAPLIQE